jgi:hypothetical protein
MGPGIQSFKEAFTNGNQEKSSQEEEKVAGWRSQVSVNFQGKML